MKENIEIQALAFEVLRVLALPSAAKLRYLGVRNEARVYALPDMGPEDGIEHPAECFSLLAAKTFHAYAAAVVNDRAWPSIQNVWCVLQMALEIAPTVDYFWTIGPDKSITGPFDNIWPLLESLAATALVEHGLQSAPPRLSFTEFLDYWDTRYVKAVPEG